MRKREAGYCLVTTKTGGGFYLRRDQYASTRLAFTKGVKFVDAVGFFGEPSTIRLDDADGVFDFAPETVMAMVNEQRADASDDSLAGGAA